MKLAALIAGVTASCVLSVVAATPQSRPAQGGQDTRKERDDPRGREQWFRRGRTLPGGEPAAGRLEQAWRQKMLLRRLASPAGRASGSALNPSTSGPAPLTGSIITNVIQWSQLGPKYIVSNPDQNFGNVAGRVTALAVDQSDPSGNTVFLGAAYGGVWKSTNAATANPANVVWTPISDDQATLAIGAIALSPANTDCASVTPTNCLILVGTGEPDNAGDSYYGLGILRSADGGQHWALITHTQFSGMDFRGLGFSKIAFSTDNPQLVVAATAAADVGISDGAETSATKRGIYYSTDAGANWSYAPFLDGNGSVQTTSITDVVYNPSTHLFYAVFRAHGVYSSPDGLNWTRLAVQPSASISTTNCPQTANLSTCPIFRGELAVQPTTGELFIWYVDGFENDQGIFRTTNGGTSWTEVHTPGVDAMSACGDGFGCGTDQGSYNLYLAAIPGAGGSTDLIAGAINIFKSSLSQQTCAPGAVSCPIAWSNLTHVYGCDVPQVHPDEHAVAFSTGNPQIVYFGNDGGIWRTLSRSSMGDGCSGNPFDNLNNATLGALTQFVSFSQDVNNAAILMGGAQDNGTSATSTGSLIWNIVNEGDGGDNDIDRTTPTNWFMSFPAASSQLDIERCTTAPNCDPFSFSPFITFLGGDFAQFYPVFMLDPQTHSGSNTARNILFGTCRIWSGDSTAAVFSGTAISPNLGGGSTPCSFTDPVITSIAAGGPQGSAGSQVIWVGTDNGILASTQNAAGGPSTWTIRRIGSVPISDITLDPSDPTGGTAYFTLMNFGVGHVWKAMSFGATTQDVSGNLPDAPADAVIVDPLDPTTVYVGTDVGVFVGSPAQNGNTAWVEFGQGLPNVAVTKMRTFVDATHKVLRVSTYGRGVWQAPLNNTVPDFKIALTSTSAVQVYPGNTLQITGTITPLTGYGNDVTVSCAGASLPSTCSGQVVSNLTSGTQNFTIALSNATVGDFTFSIQGSGLTASGTDTIAHRVSVTVHVADFSVSLERFFNPLKHGNPQDATADLNAVGVYQGTINMGCANLPPGIACDVSGPLSTGRQLAPPANEFTVGAVTVLADSSVAPGQYTFDVTATATDGHMHSFPLTVNVVLNPTMLFRVPTPTLPTVKVGQPLGTTIFVSSQDGFTGTVNFMCTLAPCTVSPQQVVFSATTVNVPLTITVDTTGPGGGPMTIWASGALDPAVVTQLTYQVSDFSLFPLTMGGIGLYPATTSSFNFLPSSLFSYSGTANLNCNVSGVPGATCTIPASISIVPFPGMNPQVTVQVQAPLNVTTGNYSMTVRGADAAYAPLVHSFTIGVQVFDFSLSCNGSCTTQGFAAATTSFNPTITIPAGYPRNLNMSCDASAIPGATCSVNPVVVPPNFPASTVNVNIPANAVSQDYTVTVSARDSTFSSLVHSMQQTIHMVDYAIAPGTNSLTTRAGTPVSTIVALTAAPSTSFTFSCSGLPSLSNCGFSTNPVVGSGSTTVTFSTTAPTSSQPGSPQARLVRRGSASIALLAFFFPITGIVALRYRRKRNRVTMVCGLVLLALALSQASCGGGGGGTPPPPTVHNPGTPPGTYTVTVTATSGNIQRSSNISLTVQ